MPWYTLVDAKNKPKLKSDLTDSFVQGTKKVVDFVVKSVVKKISGNDRSFVIGIDGFLGTQTREIANSICNLLLQKEIKAELFDTKVLFKSSSDISKLAEPYLTDDLSFGYVCNDKNLIDLMDARRIEELRKRIQALRYKHNNSVPTVLICHGVGAAISSLRPVYDSIFYLDITRETLIKRMQENTVIPVGQSEPASVYWKELYYFLYPLLNKHKNYVFNYMNWYIDDSVSSELRLLSRESYDEIVSTLVKYPLRFKRVFMPGPWGGLKFRKYFNMPQVSNVAWNIEVSGCDCSLVVDLGRKREIDIQFYNLYMQYPIDVVGAYCHKKYPGNFPIQVGLQDSFFPTAVPHERRAMPIHLHPDTRYVKKHFNEILGRYEVYYIVETYKGANTMHGFYEDADIEEFKRKVRESEKTGKTFDWNKYVKCWPSNVGDLYLIPSGTAHGTGGNQMVLEMDTCPSINGTEYSFFLYDYRRNTWDDKTKTMTAKPCRLQVEHGINQCRWNRKEKRVAETLRPKARVIRAGKGWSEERFDSYAPMPYHIERLNFRKKIETDTYGRFFHFLNLTKGKKVLIRSKKHPERAIELRYIQSTVIPACFGKYECINLNGGECTLTRQCWKRG